MPGRSIVVHTTDLFVRSFQAVAPDRLDPSGRPVNALFGVARGLLRVLSRKTPDRAVAIVDAAAPDPRWPRPLRDQHDRLDELVGAHGFVVVEAAAPLAAVGASVEQAVQAGHEVVVVGADKRLAQLVRPGVWWYEQHKDLFSTEEIVRKRFGVVPASIPDFLGLVGERDLLPGVPGVGKKSAIELIEAHGSLEGALAVLDTLPTRTRNALGKDPERARNEVAEATIAGGEAPLALDEGAFSPPDAAALDVHFQALGFVGLLQDTSSDDVSVRVVEASELASWTGAAVAMVTEDPSPPRGALTGVALAGPEVVYVDVRDGIPPALAALLADPARPKTVHGASD
ncbi:MAG: 5'-3' exonuclease H3TH domain-containing protein, partial [Myxococcota bacterium]